MASLPTNPSRDITANIPMCSRIVLMCIQINVDSSLNEVNRFLMIKRDVSFIKFYLGISFVHVTKLIKTDYILSVTKQAL